MTEVTVFFPVCVQYVYTISAFEALLKSVNFDKHKVVVLLNNAGQELSDYFESKKLVAPIEIRENNSFENFSVLFNNQIESIDTPYFAIVHNDTIVTMSWLDSLLSVFKDRIDSFYLSYPNYGKVDLSILELAAVCPYTNYSEFGCLACSFLKERYVKLKPGNKSPITDLTLSELINELYGMSLDDYARKVSTTTESWYSYVQQVESYCVLINTGAFRKVCKRFDERFVGAGGEVRHMCRQLQRRGYLFARANKCFVHHHGNLTNDCLGLNYIDNLNFNNRLYEQLEVCDD